MKIAILVLGLPPLYNGGVEIDTQHIAEYAAKLGHEVHIIAMDGTNKGQALYHVDGCSIHRVRVLQIPKITWLFYSPKAVYQAMKIKPDLIHAQSFLTGIAAYFIKKLLGIPFIIQSRGEMYCKWPLRNQIGYMVMKEAKRVIAQTETMKKGLQSIYNRDVEIVSNGIDTGAYCKLDKIKARKYLLLPLDKKIVISVGRLRPEKNISGFIRAIYELNKYRDDIYAVIVGDGVETNKAKQLVKELHLENVKLEGGVDNKKIIHYMSSADVLVNTSFSEGFPTTILEAMACGLPVVVPNICGLSEIVEHQVSGLVVSPNNYDKLAIILNKLLADEYKMDMMSQNNIKKVNQYALGSVVEKLYGELK